MTNESRRGGLPLAMQEGNKMAYWEETGKTGLNKAIEVGGE